MAPTGGGAVGVWDEAQTIALLMAMLAVQEGRCVREWLLLWAGTEVCVCGVEKADVE